MSGAFASGALPPIAGCQFFAKDSDQARALGSDKFLRHEGGYIQVCGEPGPFRQGKYFFLTEPRRVSIEACSFSRHVIFKGSNEEEWSTANPDPRKYYGDPELYMAEHSEAGCPAPNAAQYTMVSNVSPGVFAAIRRYIRTITSSDETLRDSLLAAGVSKFEVGRVIQDVKRSRERAEAEAIVTIELDPVSASPSDYSVVPRAAGGRWSIDVDFVSWQLAITGLRMGVH